MLPGRANIYLIQYIKLFSIYKNKKRNKIERKKSEHLTYGSQMFSNRIFFTFFLYNIIYFFIQYLSNRFYTYMTL